MKFLLKSAFDFAFSSLYVDLNDSDLAILRRANCNNHKIAILECAINLTHAPPLIVNRSSEAKVTLSNFFHLLQVPNDKRVC